MLNQYSLELIELMANPETISWANELIDIETALKRGEITADEARYLIMDLRDVRCTSGVAQQVFRDQVTRAASLLLRNISGKL